MVCSKFLTVSMTDEVCLPWLSTLAILFLKLPSRVFCFCCDSLDRWDSHTLADGTALFSNLFAVASAAFMITFRQQSRQSLRKVMSGHFRALGRLGRHVSWRSCARWVQRAGGELVLNSQSGRRWSGADLVDFRLPPRPSLFQHSRRLCKMRKLGVSTDGHWVHVNRIQFLVVVAFLSKTLLKWVPQMSRQTCATPACTCMQFAWPADDRQCRSSAADLQQWATHFARVDTTAACPW